VAIDPGQNDALILAITVCIDQMAHCVIIYQLPRTASPAM